MTVQQFRRIALSLPQVKEGAHMRHADFRVGGKVFATLGYPDKQWGMVKLSPEEQRTLVPVHPQVLSPVPGAWGRHGSTLVRLKAADQAVVEEALHSAWRARAPKTISSEPN